MAGFLIGCLSGILGGLLGIGGAVVMIPLMVSFLKLGQHRAHGTSLVAVVFTGVSGAAYYASHAMTDLTAALLIVPTAMITASAGARFATALPEWKLKRSFGAFQIAIACLLAAKPHLPQLSAVLGMSILKAAILLLTGVFTGFLSGMMGVGGGAIMVPALILLLGYGQHMAQGTSLVAMIPAGAAGSLTHWKLGNIQKDLLGGLVAGAVVGTYLGAAAANLLPDGQLRAAFAIVLILMGVRNLITAAPGPAEVVSASWPRGETVPVSASAPKEPKRVSP